MFKALSFAIILVIVGGFIFGCSSNKSITEPVNNDLNSVFSQQDLITGMGPIVTPNIGGSYNTDWWIRVVLGFNFQNSSGCPYQPGFCIIIDLPFLTPPVLSQSEIDAGVRLAEISIIDNQVRLKLDSPSTIYGLLPISEDLLIDSTTCSKFGFTYCRIISGLYTTYFNNPNYPNGIVYVDAETH